MYNSYIVNYSSDFTKKIFGEKCYNLATRGRRFNIVPRKLKQINLPVLYLSKISIKDYLLTTGWLDICKKKRFADFSYSNALQGLGTFNESYSIYLGACIPQVYLDYSYKIINSRSKKNQRLARKIIQMLDSPSVFVTLTFREVFLVEVSSKTRRTYVQRFCNKYNCKYVANIDFGQNDKFTKREHYHAIINTDKVNCSDWSCGIINFERIRACSSEKILAKYVNKFANHATKTGVNTRILTSRKFFD